MNYKNLCLGKVHTQEIKINDNKRVWFMKNAYAMNQFEFIEQKLQNCGLVRNQVSPSHSTFSH